MTVERIVRIVAGFFILLSLSLGVSASPIFIVPIGCGLQPLLA